MGLSPPGGFCRPTTLPETAVSDRNHSTLPVPPYDQLSSARDGGVVTVFTTSNAVEMVMAKLALGNSGIHFVVEGEGVQDLVGLGRSFGGFNPLTGPMQIRVASEMVAKAGLVLRDLRGEPLPEERA